MSYRCLNKAAFSFGAEIIVGFGASWNCFVVGLYVYLGCVKASITEKNCMGSTIEGGYVRGVKSPDWDS